MKKLILKILFLSIISFISVFCQNIDKDSVSTINEDDSTFIMQKSPTGAMLRSAIIPGWGQLYNESYWKIPIIWGASAWFIYAWIRQDDNYNYYRDLYNKSLIETSNGNANYKKLRDFYRDDRDLFAIYLA